MSFRIDRDETTLYQCIYESSDERGENIDGMEGNEICGGGERMEMTWCCVASQRRVSR